MFFCTLFPVVVSAAAMLMDLQTAKVDNGWICFSMAVGLGTQMWKKGLAGIWDFTAGSLLPVLILGGLFLFHMMGAGDIKLFCALGSVWGPRAVWKCILMSLFLVPMYVILFIFLSPQNKNYFDYIKPLCVCQP